MQQNRWRVLEDFQSGPDPIFGKMRTIVFCGFSLLPLIRDVTVQFSEKVRISPEVPRGEICTVRH